MDTVLCWEQQSRDTTWWLMGHVRHKSHLKVWVDKQRNASVGNSVTKGDLLKSVSNHAELNTQWRSQSFCRHAQSSTASSSSVSTGRFPRQYIFFLLWVLSKTPHLFFSFFFEGHFSCWWLRGERNSWSSRGRKTSSYVTGLTAFIFRGLDWFTLLDYDIVVPCATDTLRLPTILDWTS